MVSATYTVFGSSGFIGSHLVKYLKSSEQRVITPPRNNVLKYKELGHAFYCIGVTADFRQKPFEAIDAHVCLLKEILKNSSFNSFTYLSSTRLYSNSISSKEDQPLNVAPLIKEELYNITKILGESTCFVCGKEGTRVVRLSNVYGYDFQAQNFLSAIIQDAVTKKKIILKSALDSEKDYISIDDVVKILPKIATQGKHKIYNLASGVNTSHKQIIKILKKIINCDTSVKKNSPKISYPEIDIRRICKDFNFKPRLFISDLPVLLERYKNTYQK